MGSGIKGYPWSKKMIDPVWDRPGPLKLITDKSVHGSIVGQAKLVVQSRGFLVPVLGPLPKLPTVRTLEDHPILLALVFEDPIPFFTHLIGTHGDGHFNVVDGPFLPSAPVQPQP